ncbi:MAG TPA: nicotinate phosphoribosyltransferase [Acidimicrobiales bacterium]|nr:nicotinate phosphoribosyltransferase [Acidimicrobiales bacterium]
MRTSLYTDRYELTMLEAALKSGRHERPAVFEVFTRSIPDRRPWGVFAGLGPLISAIEDFRFGEEELEWLESTETVGRDALEWLAGYRFGGDVHAYPEGELYGPGSPVLIVEAPFAQAVLLETLVLSHLNFSSAVAGAASMITCAAGDRPVIEMGSRRVDPEAAVHAARSAYLAGFASTSNLEAGRRYGIPTAGTASHAFVLAYEDERDAFRAQVDAFGPSTTLLVDTYDIQEGIRRAVSTAGAALGAVRVDSGDLGVEAVKARRLLDELGAPGAKLVVTGDLDAHSIAALGGAPVDVYGVGTSVVTGMGFPTAGFVYKLAAIGPGSGAGPMRPVAKRSAGKASFGGRKWAWRGRVANGEEGWCDFVSTSDQAPPGATPLQVPVISGGRSASVRVLVESRRHHLEVRQRVGTTSELGVVRL